MRYWIVLAAVTLVYMAAAVTTFVPMSIAYPARWIALGIAIIFFYQAPCSPGNNRSIGPQTCIAFAVAILPSFCLTNQPSIVAMKIFAQMLVIVLLVGICASRCSPSEWLKVLMAVKWITIITTVCAFISQETISGRLGGLSNPNYLAAIAMMGAVICIWDLAQRQRPMQTVASIAGVLTCIVMVIRAGSRSSQAGLVAAYVLSMLFLPRKGKIMQIVVCAVALAGGLLQDKLGMLTENLADRWQRVDLLDSREELWAASWAAWMKQPLTGYGFGISDWDGVWDGGLSSFGIVRDGAGYLGVLEAVGVIGCVGFAIVFFLVLKRIWAIAKVGNPNDARWTVSMTAFGLFTALAVEHVGEPWLIGPGCLMNLIFWLAVGAILGCSTPIPMRRVTASSAQARHRGRDEHVRYNT